MVVILVLLTNVVLFYTYNMHMVPEQLNQFLWHYGVIPYELVNKANLLPSAIGFKETVCTSMFLHASTGHIASNMLVLLLVGPKLEKRIGSMKFALLFLLTGIGAALAHCYAFPDAKVPMVGASGAVAGLLGAWFISGAGVRGRIFLAVWFGTQFFVSPGSTEAWVAHVGGFILGIILGTVLDSSAPEEKVRSSSYASA